MTPTNFRACPVASRKYIETVNAPDFRKRSISCKANPVSGTPRLSPFFVSSRRIIRRWKSTLDHVRPRISDLRAPVDNAKTTTGYKRGFLLLLHASRSLSRSSSLKNRTRPRDCLGFFTRLNGSSSQPLPVTDSNRKDMAQHCDIELCSSQRILGRQTVAVFSEHSR